MLQPGKVVDAHPVGDRGILLSIGAHVNESRHPAPVFISCVGEEYSRHNLVSSSAIEQARSLARHGIFFGLIGKGKDIRGKEDRGSGLRVARWLGETVVKTAAACSGYVGQNTVERDPSFFIRIEALVEKVAQETPVLRNAFAIDALRRCNGVGIVLGIGSKVTDGGEATARHDRIGDDIDVFVYLSRLEAALQMNEPV